MIRPIAEFSGHLKEAAQLIGATPTNLEVIFTGITHADSDVEPGDIFLAIPEHAFMELSLLRALRQRAPLQ